MILSPVYGLELDTSEATSRSIILQAPPLSKKRSHRSFEVFLLSIPHTVILSLNSAARKVPLGTTTWLILRLKRGYEQGGKHHVLLYLEGYTLGLSPPHLQDSVYIHLQTIHNLLKSIQVNGWVWACKSPLIKGIKVLVEWATLFSIKSSASTMEF